MDAKVSSPSSSNHIYSDWTVTETKFDPTQLHYKETVFTIGNGYLSTRGSFEEGYHGAWPMTLINGVYDDVPVVYTELANCPDWLPIVIVVEGERFRLDQGEILHYERQLDLHRGKLTRDLRWRSPGGKTIDIHVERFASMADDHVLALRFQITPVDFDGAIEIQASINGYPDNQGVLHWEWLKQGQISTGTNQTSEGGIWLHVRTRHTGIELGMASRVSVSGVDDAKIQLKGCEGHPTLATSLQVRSGQLVTLDKVITVFTSRDTETPEKVAQEHLVNQPDYLTLFSRHEAAWDKIWQDSDVVIEGDLNAQIAIRYNLFQLFISAPRHDDRVNIPAKTLSGFGYRGHVFWDTEIFMLPLMILTQPQIAKNLLTYRYHTLPGARRKAKLQGYPGAVYAWESADTGDEVTPRWVLSAEKDGDPIRIWCGDRELHITTDVVYGIWKYWQATGDDDWVVNYGAEIILDTAVFWGTRVEWNGKRERYELRDVIGPDEYHEGIDNNAFTNRMVQWHLETAQFVLDWLRREHPQKAKELEETLELTPSRVSLWSEIIRRMWIPYDHEKDLIEQCEGFFQIEDINLEDYEPRTRSMQALLGIEGASKKQVLKQPDVLMLLYLMREQYGVTSDPEKYREILQRNWDYYSPRTDHTYGSSLGPAVHAILACELGKTEEAYVHFMRAAMVDLENVRGNAHEGIHGASGGGLWQAIIFGCAGIKFTDNGPVAIPHFLPGWTRLKFKLQWRGKKYEFDLNPETSTQTAQSEATISPSSRPPGSPAQIQGVIFDLDGVITDTAEYHYQAWQKLADEQGIPFNREANEALRGLSRRESLMALLNGRSATEDQLQEMMDRKNKYYLELIKNISKADLLPGALELLTELKEAGIKAAIGSGSKNAKEVMERLGISDRIDSISDGYSVTRSKPAPDLFLHAAQQLGLEPAYCVVVEDAGSGVEAALAAGMWAVGLGPVERVGAAHLVLPSLEGVHWSNLHKQLAGNRLIPC
ncbi:beta-phosphoglucomutase [Moorena producens]|uniref:beta-phosphoglucomutase n=1 Tax=Moorena producens TaxID=1155739 RepID=UPI003C772BDD